MRQIQIDPITRLEGHGKIDIFLDDEGEVENALLQIPELRGFEQFVIGRHVEDMPVITNRICGVCPEAHHMAASKAIDAIYDVDPPRAAKLIRELIYCAFFITDHTTHFYALGGPDFIVGPDAPPSERNLLGVIRKVGVDVGKQVIACRKRNHDIIEALGGRGVHLAGGVPGGWSKAVSEHQRPALIQAARDNIAFAEFSLQAFQDIVLENPVYRELVTSDVYLHRTHSMGTVDADNRVNFYDGQIRVVDTEGGELLRYPAKDYALHIAERVESWSYLKYPYLKKVGWKGFVDGQDSGVYMASPLARLNCADRMATPKAEEHFERMYETFGSKRVNGRYQPIHHRMVTHWARLIELLYAAERMLEIAEDPELTSPEVRRVPTRCVGEGVGSVEAPRGTLTHHYVTDERGVIKKANLIVGTTNNYAPMTMSVKRAAEKLIHKGQIVREEMLNRIEMAFRLYDPCLSCATHAMPGKMPMRVRVRDSHGEILETLSRDG
ncbi:MAG: Ni/Fe hydrogenase subunit alpha [Polyangiaceae bacterium]